MRSAVLLAVIAYFAWMLPRCLSQAPLERMPPIGGPATDSRLLLIEAEDLSMAHSIDQASFEALEKGWVSAAGMLVPAPWFPEIVRWARSHSDADLGVQLDLNAEWASYRWRPVSPQTAGAGVADVAGYLPNNAAPIARTAKPEAVAAEFRAQMDLAKLAGIPVTHLDSHGGIALYKPWLFAEYWKTATAAKLPAVLSKEFVLQQGTPTGKPNIYGLGGVEVDLATVPFDRILQMQPGVEKKDWLSAYEHTLEALPPGVYLLSVHLGFNDEELRAMTVDHPNWGAEWRQNDYDVVSSKEFQQFLKDKGFRLIGWKELAKLQAERK